MTVICLALLPRSNTSCAKHRCMCMLADTSQMDPPLLALPHRRRSGTRPAAMTTTSSSSSLRPRASSDSNSPRKTTATTTTTTTADHHTRQPRRTSSLSDATRRDVILSLFDVNTDRLLALALLELFSTERTYVSDLKALVEEYQYGLLDASSTTTSLPIMDVDTIRQVFGNAETIYKVNDELLSTLERELEYLVRQNRVVSVMKDLIPIFAKVFQDFSPLFNSYSTYALNYNSAAERLTALRHDDVKLDAFLTAKETASTHVTLSSLLIKPVQRICKYPLMFDMMLADVDVKDKQLDPLRIAARSLSTVAEGVDKALLGTHTIRHVLKVLEELGGEKQVPGLLAAHRTFLRTDECEWGTVAGMTSTSMNGGSDVTPPSTETHTLHLFSDVMIVARRRNTPATTTSSSLPENTQTEQRSIVRSLSKHFVTRESAYKAIHWFELLDLMPRVLDHPLPPQPPVRFGIAFRHVSRSSVPQIVTQSGGGGAPLEWITAAATSAALPTNGLVPAIDLALPQRRRQRSGAKKDDHSSSREGMMTSTLGNYVMWANSIEAREEFMGDLMRAIERMIALKQGQKKAERARRNPVDGAMVA